MMAFRASPGLEILERSILVLISSPSGRVGREDRLELCAELATRRRARTLSASWSSRELEWLFFSVTPTSGSTSRIDFAFDFQLSCQIVDSNLAHPPFRPPDCSAKSSYQPHGVSFQVRAAASVCAKEPHLLLLLGRSRLLRGFRSFFLPTIFFDGGVRGGLCFSRFGLGFRHGFDFGRNIVSARGCLFGPGSRPLASAAVHLAATAPLPPPSRLEK